MRADLIKPEQCMEEKLLVEAVKIGRISETRIYWLEDQFCYVVAVKILVNQRWIFLATRRFPQTPRRFVRVDVAINVLTKLFAATRIVVLLR